RSGRNLISRQARSRESLDSGMVLTPDAGGRISRPANSHRRAMRRSMGQRIVITGAAGNMAHTGAQALGERHDLTLIDQRGHPDREVIRANLCDFAALLDALPAADTVIHLGANPDEAEWQDILTNNIVATYNVFEVARRKGVKRIVFPSTVM